MIDSKVITQLQKRGKMQKVEKKNKRLHYDFFLKLSKSWNIPHIILEKINETDSPLGQITYSVHYYTTPGIDPRIKPAVLQSTQE